MLKRINYIKNFGLFKDFKWDSKNNLSDFNKYNLIYGWNFSGKTTLSRIIRSFEQGKIPEYYENCDFEVVEEENGQENKIGPHNLGSTKCIYRVYNEDFINENISWNDNKANPIFILGEENIKIKKEIDSLEKEEEELQKSKKNYKKEFDKLNDLFNKQYTDIARHFEQQDLPIKSRYNRKDFKAVVDKLMNLSDDAIYNYILDDNEIKKLIKIRKEECKALEKINIRVFEDFNEEYYNKIYKLLNKEIIGEIIEKLKNDTKLNEWIRTGLEIHNGKEYCEFCGNKLNENILEKYRRHFSQEYEEIIKTLNDNKNKIEIFINYIEQIEKKIYNSDNVHSKIRNEYLNIKDNLILNLEQYKMEIKSLLLIADEKIKNPFKLCDFNKQNIIDIMFKTNDLFSQLNQKINEHNDIIANIQKEREKAFERYEHHEAAIFIKNNKSEFESMRELKISISKIDEKIKNINNQITLISDKIYDISKASEKINKYLKILLNYEHIYFEPYGKESFKIIRDGKEANYLSSGEKTAISFAYFLTRLEDKGSDLANTIVFIDDPISSLDSNIIYNTYALISENIDKCKQIFISTHNFEFFNLLKVCFGVDRRRREIGSIIREEDRSLYIVERQHIFQKERISCLKGMPSLLTEYNSEYHYLYQKIKDILNTQDINYEDCYGLPNIVRRFLEAFIGFKYSGSLRGKICELFDDECEQRKVYRFVNELSHQDNFDRSINFTDVYMQCKEIVEIVIKAIEKKDPEHYRTLENIYNKYKNSYAS